MKANGGLVVRDGGEIKSVVFGECAGISELKETE